MADLTSIREKRKQKIIMNSEERLKKLIGLNKANKSIDELSNSTNNEIEQNGIPTINSVSSNRITNENLNRREEIEAFKNYQRSVSFNNSHSALPEQVRDAMFNDITTGGEPTEEIEEIDTDDSAAITNEMKFNNFLTFRCFFTIMVAVTARLIINSKFKEFIVEQNLIYQFVALEVIFFSYQKVKKISYPSNQTTMNFILGKFLEHIGLSSEYLNSYNFISNCLGSIFHDFAVYMFSFTVVHHLLS